MADAAIESSTEAPVLSTIPDRKPVRVYLPLKDKSQRYRSQAVYISISPPLFELHFKPGAMPLADLDSNKNCLVNVDFGGPTLSLTAAIVSASGHTLSAKAEQVINHEQMREFFRVDAVTDVISKSFQPEFFSSSGKSWSIRGRTIDISGNGLLASFKMQPPVDELVRLELTLPDARAEIITIIAKTVRVQQIDQDHWDEAFHFQDISDEDRDRIVGCCLEIQRRHLRLRAVLDD